MASKLILLSGVLCVMFVVSSDAQECTGPGITKGHCLPYGECPSLRRQRASRLMLRKLMCKTKQGRSGYCCEDTERKSSDTDVVVRKGTRGDRVNVIQYTGQLRSHKSTVQINPEKCGQIALKPSIIGGDEATLNSWPWIALVGEGETPGEITWGCGGSLITQRHVITAAHCINTRAPRRMYVRLGEHDITRTDESVTMDIPVSAKIRHKGYRPRPLQNDIAILELEWDAPTTDSISPVCLPFRKIISETPLSGATVQVAGWGYTQQNGTRRMSNVLMEVSLKVVPQDECIQAYREQKKAGVDNTKFCAGGGRLNVGKDACQGDSGGPVVYSGGRGSKQLYLFGVVSAGQKDCANENFPGLYTRITSYQTWIEDVVKGTHGVGKIIKP